MSKHVYSLKTNKAKVVIRAGGLVDAGTPWQRDEPAVVIKVWPKGGYSYARLTNIPCFTGNLRKIRRLARRLAKNA